jgi:hypothetical protein
VRIMVVEKRWRVKQLVESLSLSRDSVIRLFENEAVITAAAFAVHD